LGRCTTETSAFSEFASQCSPDDLARLRAQSDRERSTFRTSKGHQFEVTRFGFRTSSGRQYSGGVALPLEENKPRAASFQSELVGILECRGNRIIDASDSALSWFGHQRESLTGPGLDWRLLTPERHHARDEEALAELRTSGSIRAYEKEFLSRDGVLVPVILTGHGSPESFTLVAINIADRRELEARLLRAQKLESLGLIGGGVAHDFNNLLATIMGNASMSLEALQPEHPAYRPLNEVLIATRRATDLTKQMLAYCGRANVHIEPLDLSALVREIGTLLESTISKKIILNFRLAGDLPCIDADPGQIQQVVMNLVINASDAIGEHQGEIVVTTGMTDSLKLGRCVCFEVRDTGCGMTEEVKRQVFDPFFTTKADGRGLGLSAVLGIVSSHRGELMVESRPEVGTTFRVLFPPSERRSRSKHQGPLARADLRGTETILVADDDDSIRRMTRAALERLGYKVLLAKNGREAAEMYRDHRSEISVVLLDWAMPVMNGDEALQLILQQDPGAQVVMSRRVAMAERWPTSFKSRTQPRSWPKSCGKLLAAAALKTARSGR
jgi:PAS domain S-box-containing protein